MALRLEEEEEEAAVEALSRFFARKPEAFTRLYALLGTCRARLPSESLPCPCFPKHFPVPRRRFQARIHPNFQLPILHPNFERLTARPLLGFR